MQKTNAEIIELLKDDNEYYYGFGREYLSNSDLGKILKGEYTKDKDQNEKVWKSHFELGKYLHVSILEPHKLVDFEVQDVFRRPKGGTFLKTSEVEKAQEWRQAINENREARGLLYGPNMIYEQPGITTIEGLPFKGKADAINVDLGYVVDIKTTKDVDYFTQACYDYGYTSQSWVYWKIFGMPTVYVVVDKSSCEVMIHKPDRGYYGIGKERALKAINIYKEDYEDNSKK